MDAKGIIRRAEEELRSEYLVELNEATVVQLHRAISNAVMYAVSDDWRRSRRAHEQTRRAYYLSAEYLTGRMVFNNLYSLGLLDEVARLLKLRGVDISVMEDIEDCGLGNGGLGRLAACFLDSAATHDLPLEGYGLRYKFGLFKQDFKDGFQLELADNWQRQGDPWSRRRDDKTITVEFDGQKVLAVPYDMPIIGYGTDNIGTLRLWQSEPVEELNFALFNAQEYAEAVREKNQVEDITRVLYPNDSTEVGKKLRLKQQYFLSSASMQDIIRRYKRVRGNDFTGFAAHATIQLNDTHPTVSIPELVRLLMAEGMDFDTALDTAGRTFNYTNHTLMSEALEKWNVELIRSVIPGILDIIERIDERLVSELRMRNVDAERVQRMRIVDGGMVHMARLAAYVSTYINGVAEIHSELLKTSVLADWYAVYPERFLNMTNGITQRRWLGLCNPELSQLIAERIGWGFLTDLSKIAEFRKHIDEDCVRRFRLIKHDMKVRLSHIISEKERVSIPADFVFDVQVKRMHEYKRQLMNALSIMHIYYAIKNGELADFPKTAFIFGAKAAPGYLMAKNVIKFINDIAALVNNDADVNDRMRVVFVRNYNCSYAEHIIPAADISEQISPAGTEASGTGNMKLMLNGAVTLGTYDGANIEIVEEAGEENNYIFGARVNELNRIRPNYVPRDIYNSDGIVRRAVDSLVNGTVARNEESAKVLREIYDSLLTGDWRKPDYYFTLYDFRSYIDTKLRAIYDTRDEQGFARKCLNNVVSAGKFSSDRTICQYAESIWHIGSLKQSDEDSEQL
ncbi:MAG: glycogen/starch/alpha-glucan phosphorylase [Clostridia bacterium]|nr:glycogen/starch/alpha-glucan phosphorylase [Clostridia bacterium]